MKKIFLLLAIVSLIACKHKKQEREKPIVDSLTEAYDPGAKVIQDSLRILENQQSIAPWKRKPITTYPPSPVPPSVKKQPAVMYVEFNGATVSGTWWNTNGDIVCGPSGLTLDQIKMVMDSANSRFRQFRFNGILTTDKALYDAAPADGRAMCIVTVSSAWYGSAGGVAFRNTYGTIQPCFVFSELLNYRLKKIWEDVPHEFGHVFGLYDEMNSSGAYCYCSIMGVGYNLYPPRWSVHNGMNDTLVIQSKTN